MSDGCQNHDRGQDPPRHPMKPKRIQLSRKKGWRLPPNTVVVSRPSKWGNPFKIGHWLKLPKGTPATNEDCVRLFRHNLNQHPELVALVKKELRGKNLACWCPLGNPCHGNTLLEIANP